MKKFFLALLVLWLACGSRDAAAEQILFERSVSVNRSVNIFDTNQFDLDITLGDHVFVPTNPVTLFDDLVVTPADVGNVYEVLAGSPAFDIAAQRLTDAENEFIRLVLSENQPGGLVEQRGFIESNFFLGLATPAVPDLAGATLERIRLSVDGFTLVGGVGGLSASSTAPPVNLQLTLTFLGTPIPEPSGIWLLWSGIATLLGISSRRWEHRHRGQLAPARVPVKLPKR